MVDVAGQQLSEEELAGISVRCLVLQLSVLKLLLPNTLVAEVTEMGTVAPVANTPEWFSGFVSWRGRIIPVVNYEHVANVATAVRHHDRGSMVVMNTLNGNPRIPFIAVEIHGLPHLTVIHHGMLEYDEDFREEESPVALTQMRLDGEAMIVPNIDVLERMLENLGIGA